MAEACCMTSLEISYSVLEIRQEKGGFVVLDLSIIDWMDKHSHN